MSLDWLNPYRWLLPIALVGALVFGAATWKRHYDDARREEGRAELRQAFQAAALEGAKAKAAEGLRRVEIQQRNQHAQDLELAAAQAAAARNAADADRVRQQAAVAAREWAERLADSPSREDLQAAAAALGVCTDLLRRADARAGLLAAVADARRAAGLQCERDYDALSPRP